MIIDITSENLEQAEDLVSEDILENLKNDTCTGLLSVNRKEEPEGVLIFAWKNRSSADPIRSEILLFSAETSEAGKELLQHYTEMIRNKDCFCSDFEFKTVSAAEEAALKDAGFQMTKQESRDLTISVSNLIQLKKLITKKPPRHIASLENTMWLEVYQGLANCMFHGFKGIVDNISEMPLDWYEKKLSCCAEADERINGLFLIHQLPSGILMPVMLACIGPDYQKDLMYMISTAARSALELYPPETRILIRRHRENIVLLTKKLFPGVTGETIIYGERKEVRE